MLKSVTMWLGASLACVIVLFLGVTAHAQGGQPAGQQQQQMMQQPGAGLEVSDAELEKVASAYMQIHEIRIDLQESLAEVTDQESAQQMQEKAGEEMVQAVQDSGLEVQVYNQIMQEVQTNEDLREELTAKLDSIQ